jgi:hypothetical protein
MTPERAHADVCRRICGTRAEVHDDACTELRYALASRSEVLQDAAEHLRQYAKRVDGGTLGTAPILRHHWRSALRTGIGFAAMELDQWARGDQEAWR